MAKKHIKEMEDVSDKDEQIYPIYTPLPSNAERVDPKKVEHLTGVKQQLIILSDKKAEFIGILTAHNRSKPDDLKKAEEYTKAIRAIESIHNKVESLYNDYIHGDIKLDQFKAAAKPFLHEENGDVQTLKSHRGVKQIWANLLAAILSAGVIYGIGVLVTGRLMLFNPATDSSKKADDLRDSIENVQVSVPAA